MPKLTKITNQQEIARIEAEHKKISNHKMSKAEYSLCADVNTAKYLDKIRTK